jgi:cyclic pyranopterin phosphate synthase
MDVGSTNGWNLDSVLPSEEIVNIIKTKFAITPSKSNYKGEVARRWKFDNFDNEVGFISSVTQAFCSDCSRIRISADGKLYTCLFATSGLDIKSLIRSGESVDEVIKNLWINRVDKYSEIRTIETRELRKKVEMSYIGG